MVISSWSILNLQATELYDYAVKLSSSNAQQQATPLSHSWDYQKCRWEYVQLLSELGGFNTNALHYLGEITRSVWDQLDAVGDGERKWLVKMIGLYERYLGLVQHAAPEHSYEWYQALRTKIMTSRGVVEQSKHQTARKAEPSVIEAAPKESSSARRTTQKEPPKPAEPAAAKKPPVKKKTPSVEQPVQYQHQQHYQQPVQMQPEAPPMMKQTSVDSTSSMAAHGFPNYNDTSALTQHTHHQQQQPTYAALPQPPPQPESPPPPVSQAVPNVAGHEMHREMRSRSTSSQASQDQYQHQQQQHHQQQMMQQASYEYQQQQMMAMNTEFAANSFLSDDYSMAASPFSESPVCHRSCECL